MRFSPSRKALFIRGAEKLTLGWGKTACGIGAFYIPLQNDGAPDAPDAPDAQKMQAPHENVQAPHENVQALQKNLQAPQQKMTAPAINIMFNHTKT